MSKENESGKISRRDFLKKAVVTLGVLAATDLPTWISAETKEKNTEELYSLAELLDLLSEKDAEFVENGSEGWREDLLELDSLESALFYAYSLLIETGYDADEFFTQRGFFLEE
jgi:hypothetical protein